MGFARRLITSLLAAFLLLPLSAQQKERTDSLVRLISADKGELQEIDGQPYRKLTGNARFFHNNTYLMCDTALWNVNGRLIEFRGHVRILQDRTYLTSERADYLIDEDLAQFRGSLVELKDKDGNTLRTRVLDYNTADSVAVFQDGGAMRDKDGQLIESQTGTYDSKDRSFTFSEHVNMFTDSIFVKTSRLLYRTDRNMAYFGHGTDVWQGENMLSANDGWYDRGRELFLFRNRVHLMSADQEGWADSLFFHRQDKIVELQGHAVLLDTTRNVGAVGGRIVYVDSLSRVTLTRKGALVGIQEQEKGKRDTVWVGADSLVYRTVRRCDVDSLDAVRAEARLKELSTDAISTHRKRAAENAAKAAKEEAEKDPRRQANRPPIIRGAKQETVTAPVTPEEPEETPPPAVDTLTKELPLQADSLVIVPPDSLFLMRPDSLQVLPPPDTSRVGFALGKGHVRMFRRDMQMLCDSLVYCDLDSLARLFGSPKVWQEDTRQYTADSIVVVVKDQRMDRAHLMSNGFIAIQETPQYFDQIRGAELIAYFTPDNTLRRFDGLGGIDAVFFLKEKDAYATVNKVNAKMLSAQFVNGELDRILYFEQVGNNAYPIVQLPKEEQELKGFVWTPELRPADKNAITPLDLRPSERKKYAERPHADYPQTEIYFPGYMDKIYREMERRDSLKAVRAEENRRREAEKAQAEEALAETLAPQDSLQHPVQTLSPFDSSTIVPGLNQPLHPADTLSNAADTLQKAPIVPVISEKERKKAEREALKAQKEKEREERWAAQDARDAEKARIKAEKKLAKERARKRKELKKLARQAEKEQKALERYKALYEKRRARELARAAAKAEKAAMKEKDKTD